MSLSEAIDGDFQDAIVSWRRHLHAHPELSFQEIATADFVEEKLRSWGIETHRPLATCVIGRLRSADRRPALAIRADMDALPIQEKTGLPFASGNPGVMHACGHDGHTAILLGVAKALAERTSQLNSDIVLVFQPGEEDVRSGAKMLLATGALDDIGAMIGLHLWSGYDTGVIGIRAGAVMASTDRFDIQIVGVGGHGAFPHLTIDPTLIASHVVCNLQDIVSRSIDPLESAVVTVGTFNAGTAFNVIPPDARLSGTVRSLSGATRRRVEEAVRAIVHGTAATFGAMAEVEYTLGNPVLVNDIEVAGLLAAAAARTVGTENARALPPIMGGEDFAYFSERFRCAFAFVGARNPALNAAYPHHHPMFAIDERSLGIGARMFMEAIDAWSNHVPSTVAGDAVE